MNYSFDNTNKGYSFRKVITFIFVLLICHLINKNTNKDNFLEVLKVIQNPFLIFILILMGLISGQKLIELYLNKFKDKQ